VNGSKSDFLSNFATFLIETNRGSQRSLTPPFISAFL